MKLVIQIPCLNEEKTLPETVAALPRTLPGIDVIEYQIINDGSSDDTVAVAKQCGVHHVISFKHRRGLAAAFKAGVDNALRLGADILVNTDADHQYRGECVADIVAPIVRGEAEMVVGARPIAEHPEFSALKKVLQAFGSWVIRKVSGTSVQDAASGFRAYHRNALVRLNVFSNFSYTMETLIQAGHQNLKIVSVPIRINRKKRESRLFKNMFHYIWKSGRTIMNVFLIYRSGDTFRALSAFSFAGAVALVARYLWAIEHGAPRQSFWPSIILAGSLVVLSTQFFLTGVMAMLISSNRMLLEETVHRLRDQDTLDRANAPARESRAA